MEVIKVSREFMNDFACVAEAYSLAALDQIEEAKAAARRDMDGAIVAFASMAGNVRRGEA